MRDREDAVVDTGSIQAPQTVQIIVSADAMIGSTEEVGRRLSEIIEESTGRGATLVQSDL